MCALKWTGRITDQLRECRAHHFVFLSPLGFREISSHHAKPKVEQVGVDNIGLAISGNLLVSILKAGLPDLRTIFSKLTGQATKLAHGIKRGVGPAREVGENIHKVKMPRVIATQVVVVFKVAVVIAIVEITVAHAATNKGAMMQNRRIKTAAIPANKLRAVLVNNSEELPQPMGLLFIARAGAITKATDLKTRVVAKAQPMTQMRCK